MQAAAAEIAECYRVLDRGGLNVVGEVLRGQGTFYEMEHYPKTDVYDRDSHSQYYYHAHRGLAGEHGHFHTFLRAGGIPSGMSPVPYAGKEPWPQGDDILGHLIGISMDSAGKPTGLFTVNRWVTGDCWYRAEHVIAMLDLFIVDHAYPSWPVNRWISAMFRRFRPQMHALLRHRDEILVEWARTHETDVYEDRALEVISSIAIPPG